MEYEVLFEKGDYALVKRGSEMTQYAVVYGLDNANKCWGCTVDYADFGKYSSITEIEALQDMIELFRMRTETDYITRCRLEEVATLFKDVLVEDDKEQALIYFNEVCEMTESEKEFFGIETESEEEDFDDSPAWEDDSDRGCKDCPPEECTGHCMSCYYRPV